MRRFDEKIKVYKTGSYNWQYCQTVIFKGENKVLLGPCPQCGLPTYKHVDGWKCTDANCKGYQGKLYRNRFGYPDWWNTDIDVSKTENLWISFRSVMKNDGQGLLGGGMTPQDAVEDLVAMENKSHKIYSSKELGKA